MEDNRMQDVCVNCGKEHERKLWGARCSCAFPKVVHQIQCQGCGDILGVILDDDYVGVDTIYCPACLKNGGTNEVHNIK